MIDDGKSVQSDGSEGQKSDVAKGKERAAKESNSPLVGFCSSW